MIRPYGKKFDMKPTISFWEKVGWTWQDTIFRLWFEIPFWFRNSFQPWSFWFAGPDAKYSTARMRWMFLEQDMLQFARSDVVKVEVYIGYSLVGEHKK